jgi:hypothetical protein
MVFTETAFQNLGPTLEEVDRFLPHLLSGVALA